MQEELKLIAQWVRDHGVNVLSDEDALKIPEEALPDKPKIMAIEKVEREGVVEEVEVEEDWWVAGLEGLEAEGVDVVNSSVGYPAWHPFEKRDGRTAKSTLAADAAVERGVVVVAAVGNCLRVAPPADGFGVISVGACDLSGRWLPFSARGPTADGRIKPELCAPGRDIIVASAGSLDDYRLASGTSLSAAIVSAMAALILEGMPGLSPLQLKLALMETASHPDSPDNLTGWGMANGLNAFLMLRGPLPVVPIPHPIPLLWGGAKTGVFGGRF